MFSIYQHPYEQSQTSQHHKLVFCSNYMFYIFIFTLTIFQNIFNWICTSVIFILSSCFVLIIATFTKHWLHGYTFCLPIHSTALHKPCNSTHVEHLLHNSSFHKQYQKAGDLERCSIFTLTFMHFNHTISASHDKNFKS